MIETLRLEGIAIVEAAELELGPGLNVLTGETGAGKSIVLGALSLLVGGKASTEVLRDGCEKGRVEAVFRFDGAADPRTELEARGLEIDEAEEKTWIVARTLQREGRSRARVGGQLVPVSVLSEVFGSRVEISSQRESHALLRPESHGRALDEAGDLLESRREVAERYEAVITLDAEATALRANAEERTREQDFLRFQCEEIDAAQLDKDAWEETVREHARLAHADRLRSDGERARVRLEGEVGGGGESAALDALGAAAREIAELAELDPELAELAGRLSSAATDVHEVAADLERYLDRVESDPARLAAVEERVARVETLRRKYGPDVPAILAHRDRIAGELDRLVYGDERAEEIEAERDVQVGELARVAAALSSGRVAAGQQLAKKLQRSLRELGMPDARFRVELEPRAPGSREPDGVASGPHGAETPIFYFTANAGESLRPIQKVASGGELSRLFLALKNGLRRGSSGRVLIFDEVDVGVGGRLAERVGRVLAELAKRNQVLCITHLPQVAALADVHFQVQKSGKGRRTVARIERLDASQRVEEIARMAGGETITSATRRHARELLARR